MTELFEPVDAFDRRLARSATGTLRRFNDEGVLEAADVHVATQAGRLVGETDEQVLLATALTVRAVRHGSVSLDLTTLGVLVAAEPELPYERPPLSKQYLRGETALVDAYVRPEAAYDEAGIELLRGRRAVTLDPSINQLNLDDGTNLTYGSLLIATGAAPQKHPQAGLELANELAFSGNVAFANAARQLAARNEIHTPSDLHKYPGARGFCHVLSAPRPRIQMEKLPNENRYGY